MFTIHIGIRGRGIELIPVNGHTEKVVIDLDKFAEARGYKLVKLPPEPEDHIILGEN